MKAQMKVLEAVISILMVLVVYVLLFSTTVLPPDLETINLQLKAFNSLQTLDQNNELRSLALQNNATAISNKLSSLLPSQINYNVSICSTTCTASVINSTKIFSVNYIISGDYGNFNPKQIIVYMWS